MDFKSLINNLGKTSSIRWIVIIIIVIDVHQNNFNILIKLYILTIIISYIVANATASKSCSALYPDISIRKLMTLVLNNNILFFVILAIINIHAFVICGSSVVYDLVIGDLYFVMSIMYFNCRLYSKKLIDSKYHGFIWIEKISYFTLFTVLGYLSFFKYRLYDVNKVVLFNSKIIFNNISNFILNDCFYHVLTIVGFILFAVYIVYLYIILNNVKMRNT